MLRSVFATKRGRLAVAFEGGNVLETGASSSSDGGAPAGVAVLSQAPNPNGSEESGSRVVDLAYSADASTLATATEDKHLLVWRTAGEASSPSDADARQSNARVRCTLGCREVPKKPTGVLIAPAAPGDRPIADGKGSEVLVVADKCGDAYAAPLPDPSKALKHLLAHTAMTITAMVSLKEGALLATADRAEHIRVSQFPRTSIIHTYLLGHTDFVSALAPVPGKDTLLVSGGGDGMVALWDAERGEGLGMLSVRQACKQLGHHRHGRGEVGAEQHRGEHPHRQRAEHGRDEPADAVCSAMRVEGASSQGLQRRCREEDHTVKAAEGALEPEDEMGRGRRKGGAPGLGAAVRSDAGSEEVEPAGEDGVPLSVACSEDGKTVAVVVSGLEGLLLLTIMDERQDGPAASLRPRARLQLPTVPIQAGFLDGDLIVALPSASSKECLKAFRLTTGDEGAVPAPLGASSAADKCRAINAMAIENVREGRAGYVLRTTVPEDEEASNGVGTGLRKHKGTRNLGKSANGWNNFSKRRDKKQDRSKRKRPLPADAPREGQMITQATEETAAPSQITFGAEGHVS